MDNQKMLKIGIAVIITAFFLGGIFLILSNQNQPTSTENEVSLETQSSSSEPQSSQSESSKASESSSSSSKSVSSDNGDPYIQFTGEEFKNFYDSFTYPKVTTISTKPSIRGNAEVDTKIQNIAENRGYKLRAESTCKCLHTETNSAWSQLKTAAKKDGITLTLESGFRSIADQRNIFNNQISAYSNASILNGSADEFINNKLKLYSIPGYSKHHTGYTIDFGCVDNGVTKNWSGSKGFSTSNCFQWLKANNYYNVKRFGFIPSYPEGATDQGPNPESWEYVWVGEENLRR